jgi:membrane protein
MEIIKATVREFLDDDAPRLAAALSYYTVFALPAILVLILLLTGIFVDSENVADRIVGRLEGVIGDDGADQIETMISESAELGGNVFATILSLAAIAFAATGAFFQLQAALNKIWSVAPNPDAGFKGFIVKRALSFAMVVGIALLLLVSLFAGAVLTRVGGEIADLLPGALTGGFILAIDAALSLVIFTVLFAAIMKVLPDAEIGWRDVLVGAVVTAVLFLILKYTFGLFLSMTEPGSAFGAAGSLAVLLIWVYFSAMVFFAGAEFTQVWARRKGKRIEPSPGAVRVRKVRQPEIQGESSVTA